MEVYKIIQRKGLEQYVNSFTNLAVPMFASMTPEPPKAVTSIIKSKEWKWTMVTYLGNVLTSDVFNIIRR